MLKTLVVALAIVGLAETAMVLQPPLGLDLYMPVPISNPLTRAKVDLGRKLFFDKRLSRDNTIACGSCLREGTLHDMPLQPELIAYSTRSSRA